MKNVTDMDATILANLIVKYTKHRKTSPFFNELVQFLKGNTYGSLAESKEYYFLSEDYYPHYLVSNTNGSFLTVTVDSKDEKNVQQVVLANEALLEAFSLTGS